MTERLFAFDKRNYQDCQNTFRGTGQQEFYLGDYTIESSSNIDVRAERKMAGPYSIVCVRSKTRMSFRRTWSHIREDAIDVAVLWFVKRGQLSIVHQNGQMIAKTGDFVITKSTTPFFVECHTDEGSRYETLQIVVPNHVLRRFFPEDVKTGFCAAAKGREFTIAEYILKNIFDDNGEIPDQIAQLLVDSVLQVLSDAVKVPPPPARQLLSEKRLHDVLRYIEIHLSDPRLNVMTVAQGCGISSRYLFFLLQLDGTSFSAILWSKRLEAAKQWLESKAAEEISVREIAYKVGFKSPEHFSRMFKRAFAISPRAYRNAKMQDQQAEQNGIAISLH